MTVWATYVPGLGQPATGIHMCPDEAAAVLSEHQGTPGTSLRVCENASEAFGWLLQEENARRQLEEDATQFGRRTRRRTTEEVNLASLPPVPPLPPPPPPPLPPPQLELNEEQQRFVDLVLANHNVLLSGGGGTGKSVAVRELMRKLRDQETKFAVTAPTGCAALLLGGQTLHSFGRGVHNHFGSFNKCWGGHDEGEFFRKLQLLIIDEVSMVHTEYLDWLSATISHIRFNPKPFGGIQLVFIGDYLQLEPIPTDFCDLTKSQLPSQLAEKNIPVGVRQFSTPSFCSDVLRRGCFVPVLLTKVQRQKDAEFIECLRLVRRGISNDPKVSTLFGQRLAGSLLDRITADSRNSNIEPTELKATNKSVDRTNVAKIEALEGEYTSHVAFDNIRPLQDTDDGVMQRRRQKLQAQLGHWADCPVTRELKLKCGAQVMLLKNIPKGADGEGLVNGSRGVVIGYRAVDFVLRNLDAQIDQERKACPEKCESYLLCYLKMQKAAVEHEREERKESGDTTWANRAYPRCRFFADADGWETVEITVLPAEFTKSIYMTGDLVRTAVPLRLAWAITIHKSQGASLDFAIVDLAGCEHNCGQAYVALSRARSAERLQVRSWSYGNRVKASRKALAFVDAFEEAAARTAAGKVDEAKGFLSDFVNEDQSCTFWAQPLMIDANKNWRELFRTSCIMNFWIEKHCSNRVGVELTRQSLGAWQPFAEDSHRRGQIDSDPDED